MGKAPGGLFKVPTKLRGEGDQIIGLRFERVQVVGLSELCLGKPVLAYSKPQVRKKEKREWVRGERDQIKFIDFRFEDGKL